MEFGETDGRDLVSLDLHDFASHGIVLFFSVEADLRRKGHLLPSDWPVFLKTIRYQLKGGHTDHRSHFANLKAIRLRTPVTSIGLPLTTFGLYFNLSVASMAAVSKTPGGSDSNKQRSAQHNRAF